MTIENALRALVEDKVRQQQFSGAMLIRHGGQDLVRDAYGWAHRPWSVANQVDTRFRLASIGKLFTAVAVLQLVEQKMLSLHSSVIETLGLQNTTIPAKATVFHMLTMTSGIADWFDEDAPDWAAAWDALCREYPIYLFRHNRDYLSLFQNETPLRPVGVKHQYNGAGYILLGLLIERLSGMDYFDYVRRNVFERAGMSRSGFFALDGVDPEVAEGYIPLTDDKGQVIGWKKNIYSTTVEAAADGGATSTLDDLSRFLSALRNGQLLSPELTEKISSPHVVQFEGKQRGYQWRYGFGNMFLLDDDDRIVRWGHTGEEDGVSCRVYYYPLQDLELVVLGNQSWCSGELVWDIHDLIFRE
ncbi:MAG: serine hydrolase domain-containing protein [Chloroflexota bacterium]|nr:serine hydrolase domain-containing protein [Chloroflexota bacterium]